MAGIKAPKAPTPQFFISWSILSFPVTSKPASRDAKSQLTNMHLQCVNTGVRAGLSMQKVCQACSLVVPDDQQVKVFVGEGGAMAILTDEQVNATRPDATKAMLVEKMVRLSAIPPIQFKEANYLGPVEQASSRTYELFRLAMLASERVALVTYTSYGRERIGIIRPTKETLVLHECYYPDEVRDYERLQLPFVEIKDAELALAKELVSVSEGDFDLTPYVNGFRERLEATIKRQLSGEAAPVVAPPAPRVETVDMMAALQASLAAVRKGPAKAIAAPPAPAVSEFQKAKDAPKTAAKKKRVA